MVARQKQNDEGGLAIRTQVLTSSSSSEVFGSPRAKRGSDFSLIHVLSPSLSLQDSVMMTKTGDMKMRAEEKGEAEEGEDASPPTTLAKPCSNDRRKARRMREQVRVVRSQFRYHPPTCACFSMGHPTDTHTYTQRAHHFRPRTRGGSSARIWAVKAQMVAAQLLKSSGRKRKSIKALKRRVKTGRKEGGEGASTMARVVVAVGKRDRGLLRKREKR